MNYFYFLDTYLLLSHSLANTIHCLKTPYEKETSTNLPAPLHHNGSLWSSPPVKENHMPIIHVKAIPQLRRKMSLVKKGNPKDHLVP
jgi:hypothetical protein